MAYTPWSENFDGTIGTEMTSLGFENESPRGYAYITADHRRGIVPTAYGINRFGYTETINATPWANTLGTPGTWLGASSTVMPDGSTNGQTYKFAANPTDYSLFYQTIGAVISTGDTVTISIWACSDTPGAKFRFFGSIGNSVTAMGIMVSSPDIEVTSTPTRYSFTYTTTGSSSQGNRFGIQNPTSGNPDEVTFWHPQIETWDSPTTYRSNPAVRQDTYFGLWTKDLGVNDQEMECDVYAINAGSIAIALRVAAPNAYLGFIPTTTGFLFRNYSLQSVSYTATVPAFPYRLRVIAHKDRFYLFTGPVGVARPTNVLGSSAGYTFTTYTGWDTATKCGFGYYAVTATMNGLTDNYTAKVSSMVVINDARSETIGNDTTMILPPPDSHNIPRWNETFDSARGLLTAKGFERVGMTGLAYDNAVTGGYLSINNGLNQMPQSNNLTAVATTPSTTSNVWQYQNGASTIGFDDNIVFPDITAKGTIIHFDNANSGVSHIRMSVIAYPTSGSGSYMYQGFSVWLAAREGTTSVRIGLTSRYTGGGTIASGDITLTTTPRRVWIQADRNVVTNGVPGSYGYIANNSTKTSADVVAWGAMLEANTVQATGPGTFSARGTSRVYPGLWCKPVQNARQYVECDIRISPNANNRFTAMALRVVDESKFIGISVEGTSIYLYTITGSLRVLLGTAPTAPYRLKAEITDNTVSVYTGTYGVRDPKTFLASYQIDASIYDGALTATKTGFGWWPNVYNPTITNGLADNYESGDIQGDARFYVDGTKARSETTSEQILPLDLTWVEDFESPVGTPLVDLGFTFETTEFEGDPLMAVVGSQHRLTFESSKLDPAIWVKDTVSIQHFVRATIYDYPVKEYQAPIIIRAAGPDQWVGVWFEPDYLVFGLMYGGTTRVFTKLRKDNFRTPFTLKIEAKGHYMYAFYSNSITENPRYVIGNTMGHKVSDDTPNLLTANRSGVGRMNDTSALNISDNYRAGISYIAGVVITENASRTGKSPTRADKFGINGIVLVDVNPTRSTTRVSRALPELEFNQLVDPDASRSETKGGFGDTSPEAVSLTTAGICIATVDIIIPKPHTRSDTRAGEYHTPATVEEGHVGHSNTFAEPIVTRIHQFIYDLNDPFRNGQIIYETYSITRSRRAPVNGISEIDGEGQKGLTSRSETYADTGRLTPQRFINGRTARSDTFGDAGTAISDSATYRPWLFT